MSLVYCPTPPLCTFQQTDYMMYCTFVTPPPPPTLFVKTCDNSADAYAPLDLVRIGLAHSFLYLFNVSHSLAANLNLLCTIKSGIFRMSVSVPGDAYAPYMDLVRIHLYCFKFGYWAGSPPSNLKSPSVINIKPKSHSYFSLLAWECVCIYSSQYVFIYILYGSQLGPCLGGWGGVGRTGGGGGGWCRACWSGGWRVQCLPLTWGGGANQHS